MSLADNETILDRCDIRFYNTQTKCKRNRHEDDFISIEDINRSSIVDFCRQKQLFNLLQIIIKLTVKIEVDHTSEERVNTSVQNKFYKYKSSKSKFCGSGTIIRILDSTSTKLRIEILTAKHVVFNDDEAKVTKCVLNFDGPSSRTVKIEGFNNSDSDVEKDWCKFVCEIDEEHFQDLKMDLKNYKDELRKIKRNKHSPEKKAILISHPHGCYKYVSIGEQSIESDGLITYSTPRCSGSSGGHVIPVGFGCDGLYVHSGTCKNINGEKYGCSSGVIN